jgi:nucleoside-diphosphate-sugar epimerase
MRIAVTGAGGFIGRALMQVKSDYHQLMALDLRRMSASDTYLTDTPKPDHILHLAGKTFVPDSWKNPKEFYETNLMGTQQVLDYCVSTGASLTFVSSYVYGLPEQLPISENHPVAPNTPYNHSKWMGELLCEFYSSNFKVDVAVLRPFNIYGCHQSPSFLIPTILGQLKQSNQIQVQSLLPRRDYLYIDDFVEALLLTAGYKGFGRFNMGFGSSLSVAEIVDLCIAVSGKKDVQVTSADMNRENEVMDVVADISLFNQTFSWSPRISMTEGLTKMWLGKC